MPETLTLKLLEVIPVYPLKDMVAFPYMVISLYLTRDELPIYEESVLYDNMVILVKVRDGGTSDLGHSLHEIGTVCKITQLSRLSEGGAKVVLEGLARMHASKLYVAGPSSAPRPR